ncbi:YeiH family protein [Streptomyces sp. NBC_00842]|uniref:YeiH family protein n=1 Tax=Streptomyces sp. NBC_00842 TaxID=2975848 RepID=UPI00386C2493|nr:putative sulfate exporter family transporter [Streptomyces sp. NBC_00842]
MATEVPDESIAEEHRPLSAEARPAEAAGAAPGSSSPRFLRGPLIHLPGIVLSGAALAVAAYLHHVVPAVGEVTFCVVMGALFANLNLIPKVCTPGLKFAGKRLLRAAVALLGLAVSGGAVVALGLPTIAMVIVTLVVTFLVTSAVGRLWGLSSPRRLLLATGFAICGASAIAAMQSTADADEEDVAVTVALVTMCGTAAMLGLPLLQGPLGLSAHQMGVWVGASIHDVGQVVGAASAAGAGALTVAVVVKLTRVLMLAPMVAAAGVRRRRALRQSSASLSHPPMVPLFVVAFVGCVILRTMGILPQGALDVAGRVQSAAIGMALFGMGSSVHFPTLLRRGRAEAGLAVLATVFIMAFSYAGMLLVTN